MSAETQVTSVTPPEVIDVEALLAPIAGENPAGENLQYAGLHDEIREARRADDDLEQGDWKRDLKTADWRQVFTLSTAALMEKTKDLQICAWLAEALVKLHGLSGLRDSLKLMRGLHEQFWDTIYPEIDEGDLDARANSLAFIDRQTGIATKQVEGQYEDSKQFDIPEDLSALSSEQIERIDAMKAQIAEERRLTTDDWAKAKKATRRAFFEKLYALLNECWTEYQSLDQVMDEKFGRQTPGLGDLRKTLDAIRSLVGNIVKEKRISEPYPDELEQNISSESDGDEG